jgi:tetratricopeptide (TPR) repeat protein
MVRDGAPGPDLPELPERPLAKLWDGEPKMIADQIGFWAGAAAVAMHERERHPARAAAAALVALDAGLAVATRAWWTPAPGWIEAVAHADAALDADADVDPTIAADPDFDPAAARAALERFAEADDLMDADEPAKAAPIFADALERARAANAPVLALRAHYRRLGALQESGAIDRFTPEAERLLRDLPSPVSLFPLGCAGDLAEDAIQWTANWLAWHAYERGDHARSLEIVERALLFAKPTAWHDNIRDTKVRALLGAGRADEAYAIVHEVLSRNPKLEAFADLAENADYQAWCARNAGVGDGGAGS